MTGDGRVSLRHDWRTPLNPSLKYSGEALCLALIGFRLLRWVWGAVSEGDAPPSADEANPPTIGAALMGNGDELGTTHVVAPIGDPDLFPPEMLAAMTPEQRAHVLETLAKQRPPRTGT
jgi:hypothetical protein